jgi:hypothetical protein
VALALVGSTGSHAGDAKVRKAVEAVFSPAKVSTVRPTTMPGPLEVVVGDEIVCTDAQGRFLLQGSLVDLQTTLDLTEERRKADQLWCANNRAQAVSDWMLNNVAPTAETSCTATPSVEVGQLSRRLRVNATPTLFLRDGTRIAGFPEPAQLEAALSQARPQ